MVRPHAQRLPPSSPEEAVKGKTSLNKPPDVPKGPRTYPHVEREGNGRGARITQAQIREARAAGIPLDQIEPKCVGTPPRKLTPEEAKRSWAKLNDKHKPNSKTVFPAVGFIKEPPPSSGDPSGMLDKLFKKRGDSLIVPTEQLGFHTPKAQDNVQVARILTAMADSTRYQEFLLLLKSGASLAAAGGSLRLTPETIHTWYERGRIAKKGPYRRFFKDVTSALQQATSFAEVAVKEANPIRWLERGPGQIINPGWKNGEMELQPTSININGDVGNKLVIEAQDYQDALRVVHEAGIPLESLIADHSARKSKTTVTVEGEIPALPGPPSRAQEDQFQQSLQNDDAALCDPDADELDEITADNKGVNYLERGRWSSQNPSLPKRLAPGPKTEVIDSPPPSSPEKTVVPGMVTKKPVKVMRPPSF